MKHLATRPWSLVQVIQWSKHDSKKPRDKPEKMTISEDLAKKVLNLVRQGSSSNSERKWRQGPTCRRGKDLEDSGTNARRRRPRTGPKWAQAGRPRPAGPARFEAQSAPFDLDASPAICSPLTENHASTNSSSAAEEQRSLRDTISEMTVLLVV
jgi:NAD+--asparagine ADP-ribosyltransferase